MSIRSCLITSVTLVLAAPTVFAQGADAPPQPPDSQAPTDPQTPPVPTSPPTPPTPPTPTTVVVVAPPNTPVVIVKEKEKPQVKAKYDLEFYGFVEADSIYDSTQGLNDSAGNSGIPRPNTYTGDHPQTTFGARNSRIGMKVKAPEFDKMKASAQLEMDFLGNQPTTVSEAQFWQNPTMRFRHLNVKLETPAVDVLVGQYWGLFGWQSAFHPNTVEIQGVPGQVYGRVPQIRISKTIKSAMIDVDIAAAASRAPERADGTPDGTVGIKAGFPKLKAWHTGGSTGSQLDSAGIGISAIGRRFSPNALSAGPTSKVTKDGYGFSVDALIPIVPATKDSHANALTLTGSFVTGAGIADQYTGLSGGVGNVGTPPNPSMMMPAPVYTPNIDNGLVLYAADGTLHAVQWTSFMVGLQYYLPIDNGRVFLSGNYSHLNSGNADDYGAHNKVWNTSNWADGNLFVDVTPAVRLGLEFAWFNQTYVDGVDATNYRFQGSAFFIF